MLTLARNPSAPAPPRAAPPRLLACEGADLMDAQEMARAALRRRYLLQACAAHLLSGNRALQGCQKWVAFGKEEVRLCSYPALGKGKILGLQSCASVWACPVCAAKISARRCDQELTPGLAEAKAKGWHVLMVTWTIQHEFQDRLAAMMDGLTVCRKASRAGRAWMRIRERYGIEGSIRALEVTHGKNGWHPHFHELIFCNRQVDRLLLLADLRAQWDLGIARSGLRAVNAHGVKVSDTYKDVEQYVAKYGRDPKWGLAQEMSRQPVKTAKKSTGGLSPFQLLGVACDNDFVAGAPAPYTCAGLFREYCAAMKGFRQLYWTPGLKAALGVADLSDAQIEALNEEDVYRQDFGALAVPEWNCLRTDGKHVELHSLLAEGDKPGVDALVAPYRTTPGGLALTPWRGVIGERLTLQDPFADERDRLPVVGQWRDPLAAEIGSVHGPELARRLRERNARGEFVLHFAEQAERKEASRQDVRAWRASWAVSSGHLPSAVLLRLLCLVAVGWEEAPLPEWRDVALPSPSWSVMQAEPGAAWKEGAAVCPMPHASDPRYVFPALDFLTALPEWSQKPAS